MTEPFHPADNAPAPRPNFVLIGFMGSGKSSIGRILATKLGFPMVDTDALVVEAAGMQITDIFAWKGEEVFRDYESKVLRALVDRAVHGTVISTGGGIVLRPQNVALLHELGFVVLLTANEDVLFERVSRNKTRPLLHTPNPRETVSQLLAGRAPLYTAAADFTLDTSARSHTQAADAMIAEARGRFPLWNPGF
ncbi:MAG: shikimate kinase [Chthoniobacteraceae bacterium]|nr:shikimate kinase [Chthoniobacteraceae bacterium]